MAQTDLNVANASGATVRADLNAHFEALATKSAGATAPSPTFPNQDWYDTSTSILKKRDNANTSWINVAYNSGTGWVPYSNGSQLGDAANATIGTGVLGPDNSTTLNKGFPQTQAKVNGTDGSGNTGTSSLTPLFADSNGQYATVTGSFTLNDPTTGEGWIYIKFTNDAAGPHSPSFSGFSATLLPNSKDWDPTDSAVNWVAMHRVGSVTQYGIYNDA